MYRRRFLIAILPRRPPQWSHHFEDPKHKIESIAGQPALLVKIDNRPEARPQVGLNDADIVFEELTEGGITRFLAVYQSRLPPDVGPIRSVRPVDPALASPLRGVFAYSGGTPPNVAAIERAPVVAVDETRAGPAMHRVRDRAPPHNLFGTPTKLRKFAAPNAHAPRPLFEYSDVPRAGQPCTSVIVAFSADYQSRYDWTPTDHSWHRSMAGQPFLSSGVQVAPTNLIVLWVADQSAEATLGFGKALVFRDGTVEDGIWSRNEVTTRSASPTLSVRQYPSPSERPGFTLPSSITRLFRHASRRHEQPNAPRLASLDTPYGRCDSRHM